MEADVINLYQSRTVCYCGQVARVSWVRSTLVKTVICWEGPVRSSYRERITVHPFKITENKKIVSISPPTLSSQLLQLSSSPGPDLTSSREGVSDHPGCELCSAWEAMPLGTNLRAAYMEESAAPSPLTSCLRLGTAETPQGERSSYFDF